MSITKKIVRYAPSLLLAVAALAACSQSQPDSPPTMSLAVAPSTATFSTMTDAQREKMIAAIRTEGLNHSQVMQTLDYLCNVIGPRLTGSPGLKNANEWTQKTLAGWGLENAHLESWGPFGRGWTLKRFSMEVIDPQAVILKGFPKAWSPGFKEPFEAEVVFVDATDEAGLAKYKGQLKGKVVLVSQPRVIQPIFTPLAERYTDAGLQATTTMPAGLLIPAAGITLPAARGSVRPTGAGTTMVPAALAPATQPGNGVNPQFGARLLTFVAQEGAAVIVDTSSFGDGGVTLVQSASVPAGLATGGGRANIYSMNAPQGIPAQVTLAIEDYNRLVHMIRLNQHLTMAVNLQVEYQTADPMAYNTVAEIPGTDLKDEIVMLGGHMDCWPSGTGATDNGAGVAAAMEAVRIIKSLHIQPRRTIRIALWSGEEEGLLGSAAYVAQHFGTRPRAARGAQGGGNAPRSPVTKGADYEKLSVYFNLDNGTGKIRGIYGQGDIAAGPLFTDWFKPFKDLGASTVTMVNNGQTDHMSFDDIDLPGFEFIQDPIDYFARTHHTNADVYDRVQGDDLKQASTIMAAFVWNAANMDQRFPRRGAK